MLVWHFILFIWFVLESSHPQIPPDELQLFGFVLFLWGHQWMSVLQVKIKKSRPFLSYFLSNLLLHIMFLCILLCVKLTYSMNIIKIHTCINILQICLYSVDFWDLEKKLVAIMQLCFLFWRWGSNVSRTLGKFSPQCKYLLKLKSQILQ